MTTDVQAAIDEAAQAVEEYGREKPQSYEWTVLRRRPADTSKPTYDTMGAIESEYASMLGHANIEAIGELAGAGDYLCIRENRCERLTIVAETVYRKVEP